MSLEPPPAASSGRPRPRRLVFVNRFYAPDPSATSQMLTDLAVALAARGHEVHVIASNRYADGRPTALPASETRDGVRIHRVRGLVTRRFGVAGRALDYLRFYLSAIRALLAHVRRGDVLIAKTDPPLLAIPCAFVARRRGALLVNWLQDLYPEVARALGVAFAKGRLGRRLARLRDKALRGAAANVAIGDLMADRVVALGVPRERVHRIHNWADAEAVRPVPAPDNRLRAAWGLRDKFVVGYSGNLGRAHEYETLLGCARLLRDDERFAFLFIGGGYGMERLRQEVGSSGLTERFAFRPMQPATDLAYSLSVPDVHWLSLRPELEGLIVPSKFYGIAAAGRPVVAVAALDGEIARLVERRGCGIAVAPGDAATLAATLRALADDAPARAAMGERARHMLETRFSRAHAIEAWLALLASLRDCPLDG